MMERPAGHHGMLSPHWTVDVDVKIVKVAMKAIMKQSSMKSFYPGLLLRDAVLRCPPSAVSSHNNVMIAVLSPPVSSPLLSPMSHDDVTYDTTSPRCFFIIIRLSFCCCCWWGGDEKRRQKEEEGRKGGGEKKDKY